MEQPQSLGFERGGELDSTAITNIAVVGGSAVVTGAAGALIVAEGTKTHPVPIAFSPDIRGTVGFTDKAGATATNVDQTIILPNAKVGTGLPILQGVKVNITHPNIYQELNNALAHPHETTAVQKQFVALIAKPETTKQQVSETLTSAVVDGATGFAVVAAGVAIAARRIHPIRRFNNYVDNLKNRYARFAVRGGAVALAATVAGGCGYQGYDYASSSQPKGDPLPLEITKRSSQLEGGYVHGDILKGLLNKVVAQVDKGARGWDRTNEQLNTAVSEYMLRNGNYSGYQANEAVVTTTGMLCNEGAARTVYQTVQWRFAHSATVSAGDNHIMGNRWPALESNCMKTIQDHTIGRNNASALGNHDGKPGPWDISKDNDYVKKVGNAFYVSVPDPRDMMGNKTATPPSGEDLKYAIAAAGSLVAEKACEVESTTGKRPRVIVSSPEMGYEVILRGCATSVTSDHYLFTKSPTRPTLKNIEANGRITHQFVNNSLAGAKSNYSFYKDPQKPASIGVQYYDKQNGELTEALSIEYGPGLKTEVRSQDSYTITAPPRYIVNYVANYSKTAAETFAMR